jgi:predicted nuclease of restriction endonuclease-like (RecB) superfamily
MPREIIPAGYEELLGALKERIRQAQVRATLAVNRELVLLYWQIGREILRRQREQGWGAKVIDRFARDLRQSFPEMKGFSPRNLKYLRAFAETYPDESFVQQVAAQLPWFHNCVVLDKLAARPVQREWYMRQTIQHGWSRSVLVHQIEADLFHRQGQALTNFERALPPPQSDLAKQTLKDPYVFDFLSLGAEAQGRDLEGGLLAHLRDFLLELGAGFAFVGRQYHLEDRRGERGELVLSPARADVGDERQRAGNGDASHRHQRPCVVARRKDEEDHRKDEEADAAEEVEDGCVGLVRHI